MTHTPVLGSLPRQFHIELNGRTHAVESGRTILQVCKEAHIEIPVFCAHPRLPVAGNCRMCLVEVQGNHKLVASCHTEVQEGMVINTQSPRVQEARAGTLELLLVNHPLDCPVCDKGGMCDLQDLTMEYGYDHSRFHEHKRAVSEKYMGPLIQTVMTRCIHCTRCVRFATEVAGVEDLGALGRGELLEITTYLEGAMTSELSSNVIDLCPVGALNAKPFQYQTRPWELKRVPSIDVTDSLGASLEFQTREEEIFRVVPRENPHVNEEWLTDKARFSHDGLRYQRLDRPYKRINGRLQPVSWGEAFDTITTHLGGFAPKEIGALVGDLVEVESIFAFQHFLDVLGVDHRDCRERDLFLPIGERGDYLLNTPVSAFEKADIILLVGAHPHKESPLLNVRIRRAVKKGTMVGLIGSHGNLGYSFEWLSEKATILNNFLECSHPFVERLKKAQFPLVLLGTEALKSFDGEAIYRTTRSLWDYIGGVREDWNGFNVLQRTAGRVGALDLHFTPRRRGYDTAHILRSAAKGEIKCLYLLGRDDITRKDVGEAFVIYQGHHGDQGASMADVVLPGLAYTEKNGIYVNAEGRVQEARKVVNAPGEAKEDWKIFASLLYHMGRPLSFTTRQELLEKLYHTHPLLKTRGELHKNHLSPAMGAMEIRRGLLGDPMPCYYMTDVIGRASPTMAACVREILEGHHPLKQEVKG